LRRKIPVASRKPGSFLSPGYPVLPILFLAASLLVLAGVVRSNPVRAALGVVLLAGGLPIYFSCSGRARREGEAR
jgi:hypothetical protein